MEYQQQPGSFLKNLNHCISETTAQSIKNAYLEGVNKKRAAQDGGDVTVPSSKEVWKARGRFG